MFRKFYIHGWLRTLPHDPSLFDMTFMLCCVCVCGLCVRTLICVITYLCRITKENPWKEHPLCKVTWGIAPWMGELRKFDFWSYNFTNTLVIKMFLGKRDAYSILNSSQARWTAAVLSCCDREATSCGGTKCLCIKLSCQHRSTSTYSKLLILYQMLDPQLDQRVSTHCTVDISTFIVHTDARTVAISEIHGNTSPTVHSKSRSNVFHESKLCHRIRTSWLL